MSSVGVLPYLWFSDSNSLSHLGWIHSAWLAAFIYLEMERQVHQSWPLTSISSQEPFLILTTDKQSSQQAYK